MSDTLKYNSESKERARLYFLLVSIFVFYLVQAVAFEGSYGGGDGVRHFIISKWSWSHPGQLLYSWGKPFFTLVTSPFSQFGLIGIKIYNALAATLTAWLAYLIALRLGMTNPWPVLFLTVLAPVFAGSVNSGLTEPSFGLFLMTSVWLFMHNRYLAGTLLISFLPFVRSEGNMMLPLFGMILLLRGKWFHIPMLAFGTLAYSVVGWFYSDDFFWVANQNPYTGHNADLYGSGELLHYIKKMDIILGYPILVLFILGLVWKLKDAKGLFNRKADSTDYSLEESWLVYGAFLTYFIAHSIFWWKGLFGSLGLERSIAGVTPMAGIIAWRGVVFLDEKFFYRKGIAVRQGFIAVALIAAALYPFAKGYLPLRLDKEEALVQQAADWYLESGYSDEKLYYLFPYLMIASNKDPFDGAKTGELWGFYPAIEEWGLDGPVPLNTIVFWDSHFGANEARIPLDKLKTDPNFELLKSFYPDEPFKTLGDYNFDVHVFKRVKPKSNPANGLLYFDFESTEGILNTSTISTGNSFSGGMRSSLGPEIEYGAGKSFNLNDMFKSGKDSTIKVRFQVYSQDKLNDVLAVCSIESDGATLQWDGFSVPYEKIKTWQQAEFDFRIKPESIKPNSIVKIYLWNRGRSSLQMDDLYIQMK
ncbi:MAG: hypothetical protein ACKPAD_03380 [Bacteroidota bacterium]